MADQIDRADEDSRKLFLGGLPPDANKSDLEEYFAGYGEVQMATIKTDVYTGRSRGFGFLIFKDKESVYSVLTGAKHIICDKTVEVKLATPQVPGGEGEGSHKVFVGGLDNATTKDQVKEAFAVRGEVVEVFLPLNEAGQGKGFAFVTFVDSSLVNSLCSEGKIYIQDKECDVKRAKNKSESRGGGRGGFRGGRGEFQGRGGGRGGYGGGGYEQYNSYGAGGGGGYDQYGGYSGAGYSGGYGGYDQQYAGYGQSSGYGK